MIAESAAVKPACIPICVCAGQPHSHDRDSAVFELPTCVTCAGEGTHADALEAAADDDFARNNLGAS